MQDRTVVHACPSLGRGRLSPALPRAKVWGNPIIRQFRLLSLLSLHDMDLIWLGSAPSFVRYHPPSSFASSDTAEKRRSCKIWHQASLVLLNASSCHDPHHKHTIQTGKIQSGMRSGTVSEKSFDMFPSGRHPQLRSMTSTAMGVAESTKAMDRYL